MKYFFNFKNLVIWLFEALFLILASLGIFSREAVLIVSALMIFYFIFSPVSDAVWLFVASIPLFCALPIASVFDYMANWRIFLAVLFLICLWKSIMSFPRKRESRISFWSKAIKSLDSRFRGNDRVDNLSILTIIFFAIANLSLFVAIDIWVGVKKILFFVNMFLLYMIIRNISERDKKFIFKLINAAKVAITTVLGIGFIQLITVFIIPLHPFWKFWSNKIIPVFYGQSLSYLLSHSNTWFSYYAYQAPTLRMFSIFPDSHSFALFCVLCLPFFLTEIFLAQDRKKIKKFFSWLFLIIVLIAILFSGSRGIWVSAVGVFIIFLFFILITNQKLILNTVEANNAKNKFFQLCLGSIIILILLLPIASRILFIPQEIQNKNADIYKISLTERAKSIFDFSEISVKSRLQIWKRSVDSIMAKPLLGVGFGNYPVILQEDVSFAKKGSSAHNLYLDIASETGVFGLLVFLAIFWFILRDAWIVFSYSDNLYLKYWAGFFGFALIWILGYSLFDIVLLNDKVFLFFMVNLGLLYAQYYNIKKKINTL